MTVRLKLQLLCRGGLKQAQAVPLLPSPSLLPLLHLRKPGVDRQQEQQVQEQEQEVSVPKAGAALRAELAGVLAEAPPQ